MPLGGSTIPLSVKGFLDAYVNASTEMPDYGADIVGRTLTTDALYEKIILLSDLIPSQPVEDVGGIPMDSVVVTYTRDHTTHQYALAVQLTDKQLRTDQSGLLKTVPKMLAMSDYLAKQQLIADLINNGTSSNYNGYDGVPLFSDSHLIAYGQTFDNLSTAATFSYSALEQMLVDLRAHKSHKGNPWTSWGGFKLIKHPALSLASKRILNSVQIAGSANNDKNIVNDDIMDTAGNQFLTDTNAFTLVPAEQSRNPLFLLNGFGPEVRVDPKPSEFRTIYVVASDRTAGWICAQGVQHNIGS